MFGTLKRIASKVASTFRKSASAPPSTSGRRYPVLTARHIANIAACRSQARHLDLAESRSRYPEWHSRRKTKGKRDASLRSRSNRRRAARTR